MSFVQNWTLSQNNADRKVYTAGTDYEPDIIIGNVIPPTGINNVSINYFEQQVPLSIPQVGMNTVLQTGIQDKSIIITSMFNEDFASSVPAIVKIAANEFFADLLSLISLQKLFPIVPIYSKPLAKLLGLVDEPSNTLLLSDPHRYMFFQQIQSITVQLSHRFPNTYKVTIQLLPTTIVGGTYTNADIVFRDTHETQKPYFYASKDIQHLVMQHRPKQEFVPTTSDIAFVVNKEYIKQLVARYLLYQLLPLIPLSRQNIDNKTDSTDKVNPNDIIERILQIPSANQELHQFLQEVKNQLDAIDKLSDTSVTIPQEVQNIEIEMQFNNSFATHNVSEDMFPYRQYIGTTNWHGRMILQLDGQDPQSMRQITDFQNLQASIQQLIRNSKPLVQVQPLILSHPQLNLLGINNLYVNQIDIQNVDDQVSHFVVNIPFYQIDNISKLALQKQAVTLRTVVKETVTSIVKQVASSVLNDIQSLEQTPEEQLNYLINNVATTHIKTQLANSPLKSVYEKATNELKNMLATQLISKTLIQIQQQIAQISSIATVLTFIDYETLRLQDVKYNESVVNQLQSVSDDNNIAVLQARFYSQLNNQLNNKNIDAQAAIISDFIARPDFIQRIADSSILQQYDLPTIFATYRLFKKQPNEYICESLRQLVGKYLSTSSHSIQMIEPGLVVKYESSSNFVSSYTTQLYSQYMLDVLDGLQKVSNLNIEPILLAQVVTTTQNYKLVQDILATQQLPNFPKDTIDSDEVSRIHKNQLMSMKILSESARLLTEVATSLKNVAGTLPLQIFRQLAFFLNAYRVIQSLIVSISGKDYINKLEKEIEKLNETQISSILDEFAPDYMCKLTQSAMKYAIDLKNPTSFQTHLEAFYKNPKKYINNINSNELRAYIQHRFAQNYVYVLNQLATQKTLKFELFRYNIKTYLWLEQAVNVDLLLLDTLTSIFESWLNKIEMKEFAHELIGYPLIDLSEYYIIQSDQSIRNAESTLTQLSQKSHVEVLKALQELLSTGRSAFETNYYLSKYMAQLYGSKPYTKQFNNWWYNYNVSKAILLNQGYYLSTDPSVLSQLQESTDAIQTQVVTALNNTKDVTPLDENTQNVTNGVNTVSDTNPGIQAAVEALNIKSENDIYKEALSKADEFIRKALSQGSAQVQTLQKEYDTQVMDLIYQNVSNSFSTTLKNVLQTIDQFTQNKSDFNNLLSSAYLQAYMLSQLADTIAPIKRLAVRQALVLIVRTFNETDDVQQYVYDQVMEFTITREKDNPVDVQTITIPDSGLFFSEYNLAGFVNTQSEYQPAWLLLKPGVDIELRVGYSRNFKQLDKVFAGYIRDVQRQDGKIIILAEGYGSVLARPLFTNSKHFWGQISDPRKYITYQLDYLKSYQLGYRNLSVLNNMQLFLNTLQKDLYQLATDSKVFLQALTSQPYAENLYFPSRYWTGIRSQAKNKLYFKNFELHFNGYDIRPGYQAWDVIEDQTLLSPDFIAQVEPIEQLGQARLFFGKPQWPFKYKPSRKMLNVDISTAYANALKTSEVITKSLNEIGNVIALLTSTSGIQGDVQPLQKIKYTVLKCMEFCSESKLHEQLINVLQSLATASTHFDDQNKYRLLEYAVVMQPSNDIKDKIKTVLLKPWDNLRKLFIDVQKPITKVPVEGTARSLSWWPVKIDYTINRNGQNLTVEQYVQDVIQQMEDASSYELLNSYLEKAIINLKYISSQLERQIEAFKLSQKQDIDNYRNWFNALVQMYAINYYILKIVDEYNRALEMHKKAWKLKNAKGLDPNAYITVLTVQERKRIELINALTTYVNNQIDNIIQQYEGDFTISTQSAPQALNSIVDVYNLILRYIAFSRLPETTKLFNFGHRGILDEFAVKIYPEGTKPFENYHYIDDSIIIANTLKLNPETQNKIILYSPTFMEGMPVLKWLTRLVERLIPVIGNYEVIDGMNMVATEQIFDEDIPKDKQIAKVVQTHFGTVPQARILIQQSHLKKSLEEMYLGNVIITGKANIKPYDVVYLSHANKQFFGMQRVHSVTHMYTPDTGFVTSIRLMPIIEMKDLTHKVLWYFLGQLANYTVGSLFFVKFVKGLGSIKVSVKTLEDLVKNTARHLKSYLVPSSYKWVLATKAIAKGLSMSSYLLQIPEFATAVKDPNQQTPALVQYNKVVNPINVTFLTLAGQPYYTNLDGSVIDRYNYLYENAISVGIHLAVFVDYVSQIFKADVKLKKLWQEILTGQTLEVWRYMQR